MPLRWRARLEKSMSSRPNHFSVGDDPAPTRQVGSQSGNSELLIDDAESSHVRSSSIPVPQLAKMLALQLSQLLRRLGGRCQVSEVEAQTNRTTPSEHEGACCGVSQVVVTARVVVDRVAPAARRPAL